MGQNIVSALRNMNPKYAQIVKGIDFGGTSRFKQATPKGQARGISARKCMGISSGGLSKVDQFPMMTILHRISAVPRKIPGK